MRSIEIPTKQSHVLRLLKIPECFGWLLIKKTRLPNIQEVEKLTAFLPRLYAEDFSPIVSWGSSEKQEDGSISFPYPIYDRIVEGFLSQLLSAPSSSQVTPPP
jgi:Family of unknown function (DUF6508)